MTFSSKIDDTSEIVKIRNRIQINTLRLVSLNSIYQFPRYFNRIGLNSESGSSLECIGLKETREMAIPLAKVMVHRDDRQSPGSIALSST